MSKHPAGPPVPKVYELCTDGALIGDPFFIMECLAGEAFEYVTPDWLKALPAPARTVVEEAQHWLDVARGAEAPVELVSVLEDLVNNPPRACGPPCPIHGDPKHGNTLWNREGRMLALLDWEMAGVSDPLLDLGPWSELSRQHRGCPSVLAARRDCEQ